MSANSKIEWCDHTFNPWHGCVKVSAACANCYAEAFSKRTGRATWGANTPRWFVGEQSWANPAKWNAAAEKSGKSALVFCASMADVFEDRRDLDAARERLFGVIDSTPNLIWLLLTKRTERVPFLLPERWGGSVPANAWIGATAETRKLLDERRRALLDVGGKRFLSCEPLLEDLGDVDLTGISWLIVGGESGPKRRPFDVGWIYSLMATCAAQDVRLFVKQDAHAYAGRQGRIDSLAWEEKWRPSGVSSTAIYFENVSHQGISHDAMPDDDEGDADADDRIAARANRQPGLPIVGRSS